MIWPAGCFVFAPVIATPSLAGGSNPECCEDSWIASSRAARGPRDDDCIIAQSSRAAHGPRDDDYIIASVIARPRSGRGNPEVLQKTGLLRSRRTTLAGARNDALTSAHHIRSRHCDRLQHLAEEGAGARLARVAQHLGGCAALDDHAVIHEDDLVGDLAR